MVYMVQQKNVLTIQVVSQKISPFYLSVYGPHFTHGIVTLLYKYNLNENF